VVRPSRIALVYTEETKDAKDRLQSELSRAPGDAVGPGIVEWARLADLDKETEELTSDSGHDGQEPRGGHMSD
jgi:hypothetical protein